MTSPLHDKGAFRQGRRFQRFKWLWMVVPLVVIAVFASEPWIVDHFRRGHFNYVSLHSLAIVRHSFLEFGGVGYTCALSSADGDLKFTYFNRYPVPFAVITRWLLRPWESDLPAYLYAARQWMNVLFLATLAVLFALLRQIGASRGVAVFAVLGTALAPSALFYKSMFHFDQPAVLAYALLVLVALRTFGTRSSSGWIYLVAVALAALTARSAIVLTYAVALAIVLSLRTWSSSKSLPERQQLGLAWGGAFLAVGLVGAATLYNLLWEAAINNVSWQKTSVVFSAMRRLGLAPQTFPERHLQRTLWTGDALPKIFEYVAGYVSPVLTASLILSIVMLVLIGIRRRTWSPWSGLLQVESEQRWLRLLAWQSIGLGSLIWVVLMKNLLVFHEYAAMMLLPLLTLVLMAFAELLSGLTWALLPALVPAVLKIALAIVVAAFVWQVIAIPALRLQPSQDRRMQLDHFFAELKEYRSETSPSQPVRRDKDWLPRSPVAQCLMLDQPLWKGETSPPQGLAEPPSLILKPQ